jgi:hypothetical protein
LEQDGGARFALEETGRGVCGQSTSAADGNGYELTGEDAAMGHKQKRRIHQHQGCFRCELTQTRESRSETFGVPLLTVDFFRPRVPPEKACPGEGRDGNRFSDKKHDETKS